MKPHSFRIAMGLTLLLGAAIPMASAQGTDKGKVVPATLRPTELDQPIAWLVEAKQNYTAVKDYSCTLVSQESVRGKLQDKSVISFKLKEPFSVHMRWIEPEKSRNQEVIFVFGKNDNKMKVKSNVFGQKIIGWMSIDPNDKRVTEHSRHTIHEAGISNMIEQCLAQWQKDRVVGKTKVSIQDYVYNSRKCHRIELTRSERDPAFYCHRTVIYLEKESKMPIRLENFDWPRKGSPEGGELLETFSYLNIAWNTGMKDADFVK